MEERLIGTYIKEIFRNDDSGYTVGKIRVPHVVGSVKTIKELANLNDEIVINGYFNQLIVGERYHFYGEYVDTQYGRQFEVERYEMEVKDDEESLIAFLSSDLFKGVGKVLAKRIVDILGTDALQKIIEDHSILLTIKGITKQKAQMIYEGVLENYESEKIIRYLMNHGFGARLSYKIFNLLRDQTIEKLEENPYILIEHVEGIGFKRADQFARSIQFDLESPYRIKASITFVFGELCFRDGFTYVTKNQLINGCLRFLNQDGIQISLETIDESLNELITQQKIIQEDDCLYLKNLYEAEQTVVNSLYHLSNQDQQEVSVNRIREAIADCESELQITYTDRQKEAIEKALIEPVIVLTGGPGTGKTTIVNGIIRVYQAIHDISDEELEETIALVAPTGRAAKRMQETTGISATTIHRLLGYDHLGFFRHGQDDPIKHHLIICDESSMLDISLASHLLDAIPFDSQVIFVGDVNQLPSVGPGQVLKDIIDSRVIPTITLNKIQRQKANSTIIDLAHEINEGVITPHHFQKQKDRNFIRATNEQLLDRMTFIVTNALEKDFTIEEVQILAPMYRGDVGIDAINAAIQQAVNPPTEEKKEVVVYGKTLRQGDKVIQLVNRPSDFVMNGDIGFITHIFEEPDDDRVKMVVRYDDVEVKYLENELDQVTLAYCISIHKSQGSEFDIVILALSNSYSIMLRKKLVYTAVTRAKKSLIILGDPSSYTRAIKNDRETIRQTSLRQKLERAFKTNIIVIDGFEFERQEHPMVSPYDFMTENTY